MFKRCVVGCKNVDIKSLVGRQASNIENHCPRAVVLNRGAAEPLDAAESSRGAANF
jgi:hypothetical protein